MQSSPLYRWANKARTLLTAGKPRDQASDTHPSDSQTHTLNSSAEPTSSKKDSQREVGGEEEERCRVGGCNTDALALGETQVTGIVKQECPREPRRRGPKESGPWKDSKEAHSLRRGSHCLLRHSLAGHPRPYLSWRPLPPPQTLSLPALSPGFPLASHQPCTKGSQHTPRSPPPLLGLCSSLPFVSQAPGWGRNDHPHPHCLVQGGGRDLDLTNQQVPRPWAVMKDTWLDLGQCICLLRVLSW